MYVTAHARRGVRGLGAITTQQEVGTGISTAATAAAFVPGVGIFISAGIMVVGAIVELLLNSGCGQTCIVTSDWANQAEQALQQNVTAYLALPSPRSAVDQQAALANFDKIWAYLSQQCSAPGLGKAGQNCIGDRQRGSCKWKKIGGMDGTAGTLCTGGAGCNCWNWFSGYRDPIANDPNVGSASAVSTVLGSAASATGIPSWMLAVAGLGLLFVLVNP